MFRKTQVETHRLHAYVINTTLADTEFVDDHAEEAGRLKCKQRVLVKRVSCFWRGPPSGSQNFCQKPQNRPCLSATVDSSSKVAYQMQHTKHQTPLMHQSDASDLRGTCSHSSGVCITLSSLFQNQLVFSQDWSSAEHMLQGLSVAVDSFSMLVAHDLKVAEEVGARELRLVARQSFGSSKRIRNSDSHRSANLVFHTVLRPLTQ